MVRGLNDECYKKSDEFSWSVVLLPEKLLIAIIVMQALLSVRVYSAIIRACDCFSNRTAILRDTGVC